MTDGIITEWNMLLYNKYIIDRLSLWTSVYCLEKHYDAYFRIIEIAENSRNLTRINWKGSAAFRTKRGQAQAMIYFN